MNILVVYDIREERVVKVMKLCRQYLNHIQNSVFEGEISSSDYTQFKLALRNIIDESVDSIIIYEIWNVKKKVIGIQSRDDSNII
jgi:CRISPR-associated protein Cas2